MRLGWFGSGILLILTLIFSYIAIQNNKLARQVVIKQFGLDKNISKHNEKNETKDIQTNEDSFDKEFSKKLKDFDKKFNSF
jgi:hypothetical protein